MWAECAAALKCGLSAPWAESAEPDQSSRAVLTRLYALVPAVLYPLSRSLYPVKYGSLLLLLFLLLRC